MICTSISFANTISPGRYGVEDNVSAVFGDTVVMAYDRSVERADGSRYTSVTAVSVCDEAIGECTFAAEETDSII